MATRTLQSLLLAALGFAVAPFPLPLRAEQIPAVPKWQRFELTLKSSRKYTDPFNQIEVRALLVSPLGETNRVYGFWDGGKTWRVRYQPAFPGRWTYYTMCTDTGNAGLHAQTGEFLCTAAKGEDRFSEHGPVQVARTQQHFEHADRTPFLWLGDAAWNAPARALAADWNAYTRKRAEQKFNVVQWKLPPAAFTGQNGFKLNLDLFRQLEAKLTAANAAGLLNAIAPLWEIGAAADDCLSEAQAIALLRYCLARWDAEDVAWIVAFEADSSGVQAARWQRIGRAVFNPVAHSPVVVLPGDSTWVLDSFRHERWVGALGVQTSGVSNEDSLPWLLSGPLALERRKSPLKPLLTLNPPAEAAQAPLATTDLARRLLWWNLLLNTPAGVSCSAQDVAEWTSVAKTAVAEQPWFQATSLPGATAIAPLADCFAARDFWRLQPLLPAVAAAPGARTPRNQIVSVSTEERELIVAYLPEDRSVNLASRVVPARARATWFNPRTGQSSPARPTAGAATTNFTTPGAGDWVLVLNAGK